MNGTIEGFASRCIQAMVLALQHGMTAQALGATIFPLVGESPGSPT